MSLFWGHGLSLLLSPSVFSKCTIVLPSLWDADSGADIQHFCHDIRAAAAPDCLPRRRCGCVNLCTSFSVLVSVDISWRLKIRRGENRDTCLLGCTVWQAAEVGPGP